MNGNSVNTPQIQTPAKKSTKLFFSGVFVLTFANILIKAIGLLFKIPMQHLLGDQGMGYFNAAYQIYVWFYMISTAGLPIAVSILISESRAKGNIRQVKLIYKVTVILFLIIGAAGTALMVGFAEVFASLTELGAGAKYAIIALAPTLFFICISSAFRGYFQGYQQMIPTAISQVIEALGKLVIGILLAVYALDVYKDADGNTDLSMVAAYAIFGLTIGVAAGMLYLAVSKLFFKPEKYDEEYLQAGAENLPVTSSRSVLSRLVKIAIPITLSSSVMSLASLIDLFIIESRLVHSGMLAAEATAAYGNYTTLAIPMFNLPPVLIYPTAYAIVPFLSARIVEGNKERLRLIVESAMRIAAIIALPCALGLSVLSEPILHMFYSDESVAQAAPLLSVLAIAVFFVGIISVTNAILQAYHKESLTLVSMLSGACVKLITSYILVGNPSIRMMGTPIGTCLCYFTASALNIFFVVRYVGFVPSARKVFLRPFAASLACAGTAAGVYNLIKYLLGADFGRMFNILAVLVSILLAAIVYVTVLFLIRGVSEDDLRLLPKSEKIISVLRKLHLLKRENKNA